MGGGGSYKGNGGNRGRVSHSYGLMLLLAFVAALLGVMVIHKLKERRIFYLLVKEKDRELMSLQLLLEKERQYNKHMKGKAEAMKDKINSLNTHKMELDRNLLEMQSTVDSLKDEHKTMESALEEKRNEIKMLRERDMDSTTENSQLIVLTERLKQKEAEIEDLKRQFNYPDKISSASTDDPTHLQVHLTGTESMIQGAKTEVHRSKEDGQHELSHSRIGDDAAEEKSIDAQQIKDRFAPNYSVEEEKTIANATEANVGTDREVLKTRDEGGDLKTTLDGQEHKFTREGQVGKLGDTQEGQAMTMDGMKMEVTDNSRTSSVLGLRGKHGRLSRAKGKIWRTLAKNRWLKNNRNSLHNEVTTTANGRRNEDGDGARGKEQGAATSREEKAKRKDREMGENIKVMASKDATQVNPQNLEDADDFGNRISNTDSNHHIEKENEALEKRQHSLDREVQRNIRIDSEIGNFTSDGSQKNMNDGHIKDLESRAAATEVAKQERPEATQIEDMQEPQKENFDKSVSDPQEERGDEEETEESEF